MRLEPDPLDPVGTGLKTGHVNPEVRDMMLLSTRLRVWNPDVVVPPSELRCHGRRLMVQSLSAIHALTACEKLSVWLVFASLIEVNHGAIDVPFLLSLF